MMKVYVIDNGGQWTHREWRVLKYLGVDAQIVDNTTPLEKLKDADALVLSGGAPRIGIQDKLGNCDEYLAYADVPILGICAGHQYMAKFFGGGGHKGAAGTTLKDTSLFQAQKKVLSFIKSHIL